MATIISQSIYNIKSFEITRAYREMDDNGETYHVACVKITNEKDNSIELILFSSEPLSIFQRLEK